MKETIKVVCYKSKTLANGEHPLMICVCKDNRRKYQSLGISLQAKYWDFNKNLPNKKCPDRDKILIIINERLNNLQREALDKRVEGKEFTAKSLLDTTSSEHSNTVGESYLKYIDILKNEKRVRYAGMYTVSYNSFLKFNGHLDIPFSDIDSLWLKRYENWMRSQELSNSTISTRLRHLRTVFNIAIIENKIKKDCYPFKFYKIAKLNQTTPKRALKKSEILSIINYQGKTTYEKLAIDIFTFSYFSGGINFIDIAKLKKFNIIENKLIYNREKTKKTIIIPLQTKAIGIVDKYRNPKSSFIFPILSEFHKTEIQIANRLHKTLAKINKSLKDIGKTLNIPIPVTTYVARHSFATVLKKSGIPTSIISESLGHSSEKVTQIYLDSFDNEQLDKAMKSLL